MSGSARSLITDALIVELKNINGVSPYTTKLYENVHKGIEFWDSVNDYPAVYVSPGHETREYLPGGFKWGFLSITMRLFVKEDDPQARLEKIIEDVEYVIDNNLCLTYETGKTTQDIRVISIMTDEGLLDPFGAGEIVIQVRYDLQI